MMKYLEKQPVSGKSDALHNNFLLVLNSLNHKIC